MSRSLLLYNIYRTLNFGVYFFVLRVCVFFFCLNLFILCVHCQCISYGFDAADCMDLFSAIVLAYQYMHMNRAIYDGKIFTKLPTNGILKLSRFKKPIITLKKRKNCFKVAFKTVHANLACKIDECNFYEILSGILFELPSKNLLNRLNLK